MKQSNKDLKLRMPSMLKMKINFYLKYKKILNKQLQQQNGQVNVEKDQSEIL